MIADLLARLLAAWRATRDPVLEPLVERAGAGGERIAGKTKRELEARWLAVAAARDTADVARLLAAPWPGAWRTALPRALALAAFEPDPRISIAVARQARAYPADASRPLHEAFGDLIARAPTARIIPELDAFVAVARMNRSCYDDVRRMLDAPTAVADPALIAEAETRLGTTRELDALWAAHVAEPGDLAHRRVLADALEAAGDPRGQFIQLQLAGDPGSLRRAAALCERHGRDWVGPLPGVDPRTAGFARGFLAAAISTAPGPVLARAIDRPEWVTLERLAITHDSHDLAPMFRRMPLLRRLAARASVLASVEQSPAASVLCLGGDAWRPSRDAFPALAVVAWDSYFAANTEWFRARQAQAAALDVIAAYIDFPIDQLGSALAMRGAAPRETRFAFDGLQDGDASGWIARVQRDGGPIALAWQHGAREVYLGADLAEILDVFATAGAREIAISGTVSPGVRGHMTRRKVALVPGEPFDVLEP